MLPIQTPSQLYYKTVRNCQALIKAIVIDYGLLLIKTIYDPVH